MKQLTEVEEFEQKIGKVLTDIRWTSDKLALFFGDEFVVIEASCYTDSDCGCGSELWIAEEITSKVDLHRLGLISDEEYNLWETECSRKEAQIRAEYDKQHMEKLANKLGYDVVKKGV